MNRKLLYFICFAAIVLGSAACSREDTPGAGSGQEGLYAIISEGLDSKVYMDADAALLIAGAKACPAMIKPNDAELGRLLGRSFSGIADLAAAAKELVEGGIETVVVSLGGDGALFVTKNEVLRGKGLRVPVQSTVGAGDSMMATMAHGAVSGMSFRDTCALAMAVSAATVMTPGTQAADMNVVRELLPKVELETL